MHCAFLLTSAAGGGAERAMIAVAGAFAAAGHRVDLVLVRAEGPFLDLAGPGVTIIDLGAGKLRRALGALHRYVRAAKPDLLVSALAGTDLIALAGKRLFRWRSHLHISVQNSPLGQPGSHDWIERHWPRLIRLLYRGADSLSAISAGVARDTAALLRRPAEAVPVIHNPVDIVQVEKAAAEPSGIAWLDAPEMPVLLAVGRLVPQKDYPTLLAAFARLRARRPARLVVLGIGPEQAAVEAEIARLGLGGDVLLAGFARNPFAAMARASLFVLSSRWEGFANVVAEALACGATVVSTDCPSGPGEILGGGQWGRLVPVGDADALAGAMAAALDAPADRARQIARARDFAVEGIAGDYRALFRARGLAA